MRMKAVTLAVALASLATGTDTGAQIMSDPAQWYINNQIYSTRVFNGVVGNSISERARRGAKGAGSSGAATAAPARNPTEFTETPGVSLARTLAERSGGANRQDAQRGSLFFAEERACHRVFRHSGRQEMRIVKQGIFDAGVGEDFC